MKPSSLTTPTRHTLTYAALAALNLCTPALADHSAAIPAKHQDTAHPSSSPQIGHVNTTDTAYQQLGYQARTPHAAPQPFDSSAQWGWADERRQDAKAQLDEWAQEMDGWFGEPDPKAPATASLRLVLDTRWANDPLSGSDVSVEPRVRGRLRLPVLERRLSLIIGDEDLDDDGFLRQSATGAAYQDGTESSDRLINSKKTREDNASIALRWSRFNDEIEEQLGVKTDVDVGVRSLDDLYVKVSVDRDWYQNEKLKVTTDSFYRYGLDSEHYAKGGLTLRYGADPARFLNNRTTVRYRNQDSREDTDWSHDLRQVHQLGEEKQLAYGISTSGYFDKNKSLLNSYGPAITYRQPIWREWLYVQTELNYYNDKTENKDHYPSALLRMEALF